MIRKFLNFLSSIPFIKNYYSGIATILMLHRVDNIDSSKLAPNENMKVSPVFLEKFITILKSEGYEFISLNELYEILLKGYKVKRKIVLTFDDGYKDNFLNAYPILKKHKIPFTIYVTSAFIERKGILWWYVLEDLILNNDEVVLSNGMKFRCVTKKEKEQTFLEIRKIILSTKIRSFEDFFKNLNEMFSNYKIDWFIKTQELCMNKEELHAISQDELCTIGGHTINHLPLSQLPIEEVKKEIIEANRKLGEIINKRIEHFAYPFGSKLETGHRELQLVKNLNLKTATTTRRGNIYLEHKNYMYCLPRIMLIENFDIRDIWRIRKKNIVTI